MAQPHVNVKLRPAGHEDIPTLVAWEGEPDNAPFIVRWSADRHAQAQRDDDIEELVVEEGGSPVGFVILAGLAGPDDSVEFRRIVIHRKGVGLGRATVEAVLHRCFDVCGARRVWLDVKEDNRRARALYEAIGFRVEGTPRDRLKTDEGFESLVVMSILEPEYRARPTSRACGG